MITPITKYCTGEKWKIGFLAKARGSSDWSAVQYMSGLMSVPLLIVLVFGTVLEDAGELGVVKVAFLVDGCFAEQLVHLFICESVAHGGQQLPQVVLVDHTWLERNAVGVRESQGKLKRSQRRRGSPHSPDPSSSKQAKALRMTSSGSVPLSLSPNMVRNMVKLMGPGASDIIPSRYSSEGFLPVEIDRLCRFLLFLIFLKQE